MRHGAAARRQRMRQNDEKSINRLARAARQRAARECGRARAAEKGMT